MRVLSPWEEAKNVCLECIRRLDGHGLWVTDCYTPTQRGTCQECGVETDLFPSIITEDPRFRYHDQILRMFPDNYCMCGYPADFVAQEMTDRFDSVTFLCAECARIRPGWYCPIERIQIKDIR